MDDLRAEFWADLQMDLVTVNSAVYLANHRLEDVVRQAGWKVHRPIASNPSIGTYVPHSDIAFDRKTATKQTLTVDKFRYSAEDIDDTEEGQTEYDLVSHSSKSVRQGLGNIIEQEYLSEIVNARQAISGSPVTVSSTNVLDILEEAEGKMGAIDATYETAMRAIVLGPRTVAKLRRAKSDRESRLGDEVLANGVVGPWQGWTVVQNNNLPWSATLTIATQPTDGDTVTIAGVVFTFKTTLGTDAGNVLIGASATTARANLEAAVEGAAGAGTTYVELANRNKYVLRRKRRITTSNAQAMAFVGFGDVSVSETLTAAADVWSSQQQKAVFMIRGAIDLVVQFRKLEVIRKEKGFADLVKGLIGIGTRTFDDGADLMVGLTQDASGF